MTDPLPPAAPTPDPDSLDGSSDHTPQPEDAADLTVPHDEQTQPGAPATATSTVRPLRGIGAATRWLILVVAVLSFVSMVLDALNIVVAAAFSIGLVDNDVLHAAVVGLQAVTYLPVGARVAAAVCWVVWQYRAAASFPAGALRRLPGAHVASWFIPVLSWWFPFQNISDLARVSRARLGRGIRGTWWALWICCTIPAMIASGLIQSINGMPVVIGGLMLTMLGHALLIGAAVFAWIVVARITAAIDPAGHATPPMRPEPVND